MIKERVIEAIKEYSIPVKTSNDFDPLLEEIKEQNYVLLGEASHGTSEFYQIRAELTKKLIEEKGFTFIAVEGDWPACQNINRFIKGYDFTDLSAEDVLRNSFDRWPTWMWANEEMIELVDWLKDYNSKQPKVHQVGFYGIDIYSLWDSIDEVLKYLTKTNSPELEHAKKAFACFEPFNRQPEKYGVSAALYHEGCRDEVIKLLTKINENKSHYIDQYESNLNLGVNTLIMANAENYYKTMITDDNESWNLRDRHMVEVIKTINLYNQGNAKGIIWEHNTHVGDARATDMKDEGLVNVGQLIREQCGEENIYIIGFGTHRGTVISADQWGSKLEQKIVPPAQSGSWEDLFHLVGSHDKILIFTEENKDLFHYRLGHRAIGVVYNPYYEHYGNYVPTVLSQRYNAFIYVNHSNALHPLKIEHILI